MRNCLVLSDEIVLCGFDLKSKDGAIAMVENVITGKDDNPKILYDRFNLVPKVLPKKL